MSKELNRTTADAPAAPIRLVHLGLGAFHRAHQVWYTQHAEDGNEWGYASFTGRGPKLAEALAPQDGLYTLVTRADDGDSTELITALSEAQPADNLARLVELMAGPDVAMVTLTVTEAGYHLTDSGTLDMNDADVVADVKALRAAHASGASDAPGTPGTPGTPDSLDTAAGRIVAGLAARRAGAADADSDGSGSVRGIAVMSCDNVAGNGEMTRAAVLGTARAVDPELAEWIERTVTFPSTSIDRITPATTDELIEEVTAETGYADNAPGVAEPFASWVISGDFPAGRPAWETAGAEFVDDIEQFERRKLWLLNGSHSLMAYYGQLRGHETVADAIADEGIRAHVEALWDEAAHHLTADGLDVPGYREALLERFNNPRIRHNLAQIGIDGGTKQRMRAVPIMKAERRAGRDGKAAAFSIAAWIAFLLRNGGSEDIADSRADVLNRARQSSAPVAALVSTLDEGLGTDRSAVELIRELTEEISSHLR